MLCALFGAFRPQYRALLHALCLSFVNYLNAPNMPEIRSLFRARVLYPAFRVRAPYRMPVTVHFDTALLADAT